MRDARLDRFAVLVALGVICGAWTPGCLWHERMDADVDAGALDAPGASSLDGAAGEDSGLVEDLCFGLDPRSYECAVEMLGRLEHGRCEEERACGRPMPDWYCDAYYPSSGGRLRLLNEDELTLLRLGQLEFDLDAARCRLELLRTCRLEEPTLACGPLFVPVHPIVGGEPCRDDVQCGPDMQCDFERTIGPRLCVLGSCVPRLPDGAPCEEPIDPGRFVALCRIGSICLDGGCAPLTGSDPATLGESCGYVPVEGGAVYRGCREGGCRPIRPSLSDVCRPNALEGEDCTRALCAWGLSCTYDVCVPHPQRPGAACDADNEGDWCAFNAYGLACVEGVCVENPRRIGDACSDRNPCVEGVCTPSPDGARATCQPALALEPGELGCERSHAHCASGLCCFGDCVDLGGPS
jgi:hypothetical protein